MATRKYPPHDDEGILDAGDKFADNVGDPKDIGLSDDDLTRLTAANTAGRAAFNTHKASQAKARTDAQAKDDGVGLVEDILQEFNGRVQGHPAMTDTLRTALGLPIYDAVKTKAPAPSEMPVVSIDTATPLRHEIAFSGEGIKGKPAGVREMEIYLKIGGDATGNPSDYQYKGRDTDPPYTVIFDVADSGKQAHYLFCWLNASGERGPWKMASATITRELQTDRP